MTCPGLGCHHCQATPPGCPVPTSLVSVPQVSSLSCQLGILPFRGSPQGKGLSSLPGESAPHAGVLRPRLVGAEAAALWRQQGRAAPHVDCTTARPGGEGWARRLSPQAAIQGHALWRGLSCPGLSTPAWENQHPAWCSQPRSLNIYLTFSKSEEGMFRGSTLGPLHAPVCGVGVGGQRACPSR